MTDGVTQEEVLKIVREVLDVDPVRPEDDLFDLGFTSLAIVKTAARVSERLDADLPLSAYFDAATVADLVAAVAAARPR
ncbi:acyl carrier protein [Plantactinospora sp. B6F1]|uniref:phosphopantetheine-binding protein n=1 Tax=Plantactinospora sp. B6F1 TaxID=3158971 RepID=UPI00102C0DE8